MAVRKLTGGGRPEAYIDAARPAREDSATDGHVELAAKLSGQDALAVASCPTSLFAATVWGNLDRPDACSPLRHPLLTLVGPTLGQDRWGRKSR